LVNKLPSVTGTVSPSVGVLSLNASFTAQGQGGVPNYTYSWQFGDGTSSDSQNPTHEYSQGKYTATVLLRDGAGMTASWSVSISVNLPLVVGIIARWIGPGDMEEFICTPTGGVPPYTFYWTFGTGMSSTLQNTTNDYRQPGTTTISLTVTDSIGETVYIEKAIQY
jgi:PKD repeat protein